jgi:hypothetical protein
MNTAEIKMPLFYNRPVALNSEVHRDFRVAPSPDKFKFTKSANFVLMTVAEFYDASREFPIIFSQGEDGKIAAMVLLGIESGENLYVDQESGEWAVSYVPAYIRRYPYITADVGAETFPVCIDESYAGFQTKGEGQRIFDETGEPTEYCLLVQKFLTDYQHQGEQTAVFAEELEKRGLFKSVGFNVEGLNGQNFSVKGFLAVDEEKLAQLDDEAIISLFKRGYLGLIYAHLASLRNLSRLVEMKSKAILLKL